MKKEYKYNNIHYDSAEEIDFQIFLDEAKELGLILDFEYQPKSFELIPKAEITVKGKKKVLLRSYSYTADWRIKASEMFDTLPHKWHKNEDGTYLVDIKGEYNRHGGDRIFPINQKLLYNKYNVYVNKVIPKEFFKIIDIAPEGVRWNKIKKTELKKDYKTIGSFEDFKKKQIAYNNKGTQINFKFLKNAKP